jgi:hypothetical protein
MLALRIVVASSVVVVMKFELSGLSDRTPTAKSTPKTFETARLMSTPTNILRFINSSLFGSASPKPFVTSVEEDPTEYPGRPMKSPTLHSFSYLPNGGSMHPEAKLGANSPSIRIFDPTN